MTTDNEEVTDLQVNNTVVPDSVATKDGVVYYIWEINPEVFGITGPTTYYYYTSDTIYDPAAGVPRVNIDEIDDFATNLGSIEEIDGTLRGNPLELLIDDILLESKINPFLLTQEAEGAVNAFGENVGGQYAYLLAYLDNIYSGTNYGNAEYEQFAPSLKSLTADQRAFTAAWSLGSDSDSNASLRVLEDKAKLEISGLVAKYAMFDMDENLIQKFYEMRLTGKLDANQLRNQFKLAVFSEIPGYRDPELQGYIADNNYSVGKSKALLNQVNGILNSTLGNTLSMGFTAQDKDFLVNALAVEGGAEEIQARAQGIWDGFVADRFKGSNYSTTLAGLRPVIGREGTFDEDGRDVDLVMNILQENDSAKIPDMIRAHFLNVQDEGALAKMASTLKNSGIQNVIAGGAVTGVY